MTDHPISHQSNGLAAVLALLVVTLLSGACAPTAGAATVVSGGATMVSAGGWHDCVVVTGGTAQCWGYNAYGQLGNGSFSPDWDPTPVPVSGLGGVNAISAGSHHTCALIGGGAVRCWGWGAFGQLGDGEPFDGFTASSTAVPVSGLSGAVAITSDRAHSCALLGGGTAKCWGYGGALGEGATDDSSTPVAVSGLSGATAISAGEYHTCALVGGGMVKCWGGNHYGQLGDGSSTDSAGPVAVSGLSGATAISAGRLHTCALIGGGTVKCWGWNHFGQLGDGTTMDRQAPVPVSGLSGAVAISAGQNHTCALLADGTVTCWGAFIVAGIDTGIDASSTPVPVSGLSGVTAISAGGDHTCALLGGGAVTCWGDGHGSLGKTSPVGSPVPPRVTITSHPRKETTSKRARFGFTGVSGGTYSCSVDAGRWRSCLSGDSFGPLGPGDHRFRVRETLAGLTGPTASYSWTIALPRKCVLRVARARVFIFARKRKVRLVIRYKTYRPARVVVSYKLFGKRGKLQLGRATARFRKAGLYRLPKRLRKRDIRKVRAARLFRLRFKIPKTPRFCGRYYSKRLTIPKKVRSQRVWFQSDSIFR